MMKNEEEDYQQLDGGGCVKNKEDII